MVSVAFLLFLGNSGLLNHDSRLRSLTSVSDPLGIQWLACDLSKCSSDLSKEINASHVYNWFYPLINQLI